VHIKFSLSPNALLATIVASNVATCEVYFFWQMLEGSYLQHLVASITFHNYVIVSPNITFVKLEFFSQEPNYFFANKEEETFLHSMLLLLLVAMMLL